MSAPPLLRVLRETLAVLEATGVRFAVLGGFAVRVWGIPRPTYDLDIAIAAGRGPLRRVMKAFPDAGFEIPEAHLAGFLDSVAGMSKCTVHRLEQGHVWEVDIFVASTPFLRSALRRSVTVSMEGRRVPVLKSEDIVLLKLVAGRRKDLVDVEEILVLGGGLDRRRLELWRARLGVSRALARAMREAGLTWGRRTPRPLGASTPLVRPPPAPSLPHPIIEGDPMVAKVTESGPEAFSPVSERDEGGLDLALRPRSFDGFVGQRRAVENLKVAIEAARQRGEPLDHVLLSGLPGLGKTTLACLLAKEMGSELRLTSGPALGKAADLAGILANLQKGDVLFVDEVHRLQPAVEEYLYTAMEEYAIDILIDTGASARSLRVTLQPFTLVGATTREGLLTAPFRSRFGITEKLEPYPPEDLREIVRRSADLLGVEVEPGATGLIAARSRGTPRIANRFLKRVRDLAQLVSGNRVTEAVAEDAMGRLGVDGNGLSEVDRSLLRGLARAGGGPVGLKTVALLVGEEQDTVEDVIEPFLLQQGYLDRTPRGRRLTDRGFAVVGATPPRGTQPPALFA